MENKISMSRLRLYFKRLSLVRGIINRRQSCLLLVIIPSVVFIAKTFSTEATDDSVEDVAQDEGLGFHWTRPVQAVGVPFLVKYLNRYCLGYVAY